MKKEKKSSIFWILIIFFVLFSIWQLWVPEALDDWRWGSEVGIMRLKTWFEGYNGRYFGDILVIVLTRLPIVLRSMAISGIMTAMLYLIYQLTEYKILSFLICVFFVVNIPTSLMSQTYGWVSGFSNFCVSATTILGFLLYHISIFKERKVSKLKTGISMINAFLGSLVLENSTVYLIVLSIAFLIIYGVQYKKLHKGMLLHLIMVGIGAFWMFSNSAYRMAAAHTSQGTGKEIAAFELSFEWFASALKVYADTIINYWIMPNHLLNIVTCGLILILLQKRKKKGQGLFLVLFSVFLAFYIFNFMNLGTWKDYLAWGNAAQAVIVTTYCLALAAFSAWFITDFKDKVIVQIILWSQLILMGPLIVASPIAIRCFYVTYIFFVLYLGVLLSYSIRSGFLKISKGYLNTGIMMCIFFVMIGNIGVYYFVHGQVNDRLQYIQTQIKQGEKKIELKEIPLGDTYCYGLDVYNPAWVWRYKMYYNIPGDIELKFPER